MSFKSDVREQFPYKTIIFIKNSSVDNIFVMVDSYYNFCDFYKLSEDGIINYNNMKFKVTKKDNGNYGFEYIEQLGSSRNFTVVPYSGYQISSDILVIL